MGLFKKKQKVFGESIEPCCDYCRYNSGEDDVRCPYITDEQKTCINYEYDPTLRVPKGTPKLRKYNEDDFLL